MLFYFSDFLKIIYSSRLKGESKEVTEYRRRLNEVICWLTKAENAVQKKSMTELEQNIQELTVSSLFIFIVDNDFRCMNIYTKNKTLMTGEEKE